MGIYEAGKYIEVHPTFLYESISTLTTFIILTVVSKNRQFKGQITYLYLMISLGYLFTLFIFTSE